MKIIIKNWPIFLLLIFPVCGRADISKGRDTAVVELPIEQVKVYFDTESIYVMGSLTDGIAYKDTDSRILVTARNGRLSGINVYFAKTPSVERIETILAALLKQSVKASDFVSQGEGQSVYWTKKAQTIFIKIENASQTVPFVDYTYRVSLSLVL